MAAVGALIIILALVLYLSRFPIATFLSNSMKSHLQNVEEVGIEEDIDDSAEWPEELFYGSNAHAAVHVVPFM